MLENYIAIMQNESQSLPRQAKLSQQIISMRLSSIRLSPDPQIICNFFGVCWLGEI